MDGVSRAAGEEEDSKWVYLTHSLSLSPLASSLIWWQHQIPSKQKDLFPPLHQACKSSKSSKTPVATAEAAPIKCAGRESAGLPALSHTERENVPMEREILENVPVDRHILYQDFF